MFSGLFGRVVGCAHIYVTLASSQKSGKCIPISERSIYRLTADLKPEGQICNFLEKPGAFSYILVLRTTEYKVGRPTRSRQFRSNSRDDGSFCPVDDDAHGGGQQTDSDRWCFISYLRSTGLPACR